MNSLYCRLRPMWSIFVLFSVLVACVGEPEVEAWDCEPGSAGEECESCDEGTFCAGGDTVPVACEEEGSWDHDGNPATECEAWTECESGEFVSQAGSGTSDRQCAVCEGGTYSTTRNAASCEAWTECESGEFVSAAGSGTSDRQCVVCEGGTYSTTTNAASCEAWTGCVSGEFVSEAGSHTEDRQCAECEEGTYSETLNAAECLVWTECGQGEYALAEGTATMDRQCYLLPSGWAFIPAGTYTQGSPLDEPGRTTDEVQREVIITRGFLLQETPVTQGQWEALMGNNPSSFQSGFNTHRPVERVSWWDGIAYLNALSAAEGLEACYEVSGCTGTSGVDYVCSSIEFAGLECEGYRLPTEAEWEYAARAGTTGMTYAGNHHGLANCNANVILSSIAWWCGNAGSTTDAVGQKDRNDWGLYDMIGNVWEWTNDWYGAYEPGSVTDPVGPSTASNRVYRGCSWGNIASFCRAAYRGGVTPAYRGSVIGFRPARSIP